MKQTNNYFKNGALILVAAMFLVIPNLNVYSSIGSYKIASSAIVANKVHQTFVISNHDNTEDLANVILAITVEGLEETAVRALMGLPLSEFGYYPTRAISKTYAKYDFSGFDN